METRVLDILPVDECIRLLRSEEIGRVAFVAQDLVHVIPVNYMADERGCIVFRTASRALVTFIHSVAVAFETDRIDAHARTGWSVCVHGVGRELTDVDDADAASALRRYDVEPWAEGDRDRWFAVIPGSVTGRRLGLGPPPRDKAWFPGIPTT